MSYIRTKEIPPRSGNWYKYEVMGIRKGNKVRQKVIRYLGRVGSGYPLENQLRREIPLWMPH